ncbi:nucleotidyltransferase family protein [Sinomicrobium kalidii]|uniref:nucleotidyltransferase family protein n=1 Tax=Sinomicrobium kalidii TaxID=2900738 RepID=UPI001E47CBC4|nr:nucleotidyltransferase family protein [Sinomicrobium kalidii]UGU16285.1 nucleotidyltransferase family protein [Sinomicrobium kalidii]
MTTADKIRTRTYGIIILAAGSSARMGQPKQLLEYRGKSLLQHAIDEATKTGVKNIVVILGNSAGSIKQNVKQNGTVFLENPEYEEGMASGIRLGVGYLTKDKENMIEGILVMLCDQPFVNSELLTKLLERQITTDAPVVASSYRNKKGVPALFHKDVFPELLALKGDKGARGIIRKNDRETITVEFPRGNTDIDTPEDYKKLVSGH